MKQVENAIRRRLDMEGHKGLEIQKCKFEKKTKIDPKQTGIYVIFDILLGMVMYVGEGKIVNRLVTHWAKSTLKNLNASTIKDVVGWRSLREDINYDIGNWQIFYVYINDGVEEEVIEKGLIKDLRPYANKKIHLQRIKNNKTEGGQ